MSVKNLSFKDAFGFHSTRQMQMLQPKASYSEARGITWGYNFRKILTYLPIISTITGIMTILILSFKKPCAVRAGLILRSVIFDILLLGLAAAIVDSIMTIYRSVHLRNRKPKGITE